jgi:protocatechuate 3,4-dioxygenase beta subunit
VSVGRARRTAVAIAMVGLAVTGFEGMASPAQAAGGPISGVVFRDYNANGAIDNPASGTPAAADTGLAGVTVTAYDPAGATAGATTSDAVGQWNLVPTGTGPYRVEFTGFPGGYQPTSAGGNAAATTVQFVPATGGTDVNLGLNRPGEYCQDNPELVVNCYVFGDQSSQADPVLVSFPYGAGALPSVTTQPPYDVPTTHQLMIPGSQVGATWGLAYAKSSKRLFAASFMKKHIGFGPSGTGAIYQIDRSTGTPVVSMLVDLNAVLGPATTGTDPHDPTNYDTDNGDVAWDAVGKVSLGGLAVSDDESTLYAMNLADRKLYAMPTSGAVTASSVVAASVPLNPPGCLSAGDVRPFAVNYHEGSVYIGLVCSAESTQVSSQMRAYIYRADPTSLAFDATPVLDIPLTYFRGGGGLNWRPWIANTTTIGGGGSNISYPQPWLTDFAFDGDDVVLGLRDRLGDQTGNGSLDLPALPTRRYSGTSQGDTLRACGPASPTYTLESKATCGAITTAGVGNNGPGKGEYYYQDDLAGTHPDLSGGGLTQIPGYRDVAVELFDPIPLSSATYDGGVRWFNNSTGMTSRAYRLFNGGKGGSTTGGNLQNNFGKANGLGDLTALCDAAPIEIGNRLWRDIDGDGVQDSDEPPLAGVTVELWNSAGVKVGVAITGADGGYRFTSVLATDTDLTDGVGAGVKPNSSFEIRVANATGASAQPALAGLTLTAVNSGTDLADSDAALTGTTAVIPVTTGPAGFNNHTYDIGFATAPPVSLGNQVWLDTNNDGTKQASEVAHPGVRMELFLDANDDGALTGAEQTPIAVDTTDGNGLYLFTERTDAAGNPLITPQALTAGRYLVGVAPSNFATGGSLAGYHSSGTALDASGTITDGIVNSGDVDSTDHGREQDAGFYASGVLSQVVTVEPGTEPTGEDPNNNLTTIPDGDSNLTLDFGFYSASLGSQVWVDNSAAEGPNNGTKDPDEAGLAGVPVSLYAADGVTLIASTTTGADGNYHFDGLVAGTYVVKITAPSGYRSATDLASTANPGSNVDSDDNGTGSGSGVILSGPVNVIPGFTGATGASDVENGTARTTDPTVDFAVIPTVSVGDFVWWDTNKNGIQESGEPGVPGATVTLFAANGTTPITADALGNPIAAVTTDGTGAYTFDSLPPGTYVVKFSPPASWLPSPVGAGGDPNVDSNGAMATSAVLTSGQRDATLDSGFYPIPPALGDFIWQDRNGNGVQDSGEPGLAGATVTLFESDGTTPVTTDSDGNPIAPVVTTASGAYVFSNLRPGKYVVTFTPPAGWQPTITGAGTAATDSNGATASATLAPGDVNLTLDSGFILPTVSVGNYVWFDADHNGVQGSTESGLAGVTATLFAADGVTKVTQDAYGNAIVPLVTAADGKYLFADLLPGRYVVKFAAPAGYSPTITGGGTAATDSNGVIATSVVLAGGEQDLTLDSGFWQSPVSVGNYVWFDADHNGVQGSTESGLAGVTATLFAADGVTKVTQDAYGNAIVPLVTAADGKYLFADLLPGRYVVKFAAPAGYSPTITGGGTAATDSNGVIATSVVLAGGEQDLTLDSGFWQPASLGDTVWMDLDADGVRDPSEPGVASVTVRLLDSSGRVVGTTVTDSAGHYIFTGLTPDSYSVLFIPPPGLLFTGSNRGGDAVDSDADPVSGKTPVVTLIAGENNVTLDAGVITAGSISGVSYLDVNRNDRLDPNDTLLAGIKITLSGTDIFGAAVTLNAVTEANGSYHFLNLRPGTYLITESLPGGKRTRIVTIGVGELSAGNDFKEQPQSTPSAPSVPGGEKPLARTGAAIQMPLGLGSLLIAAGIGLYSVSRRRIRSLPRG